MPVISKAHAQCKQSQREAGLGVQLRILGNTRHKFSSTPSRGVKLYGYTDGAACRREVAQWFALQGSGLTHDLKDDDL
eukprot:3978533-Pleurochrysis_carterae.AAC.1